MNGRLLEVGEAPYFVIAVAVGGFFLSLLSICLSLLFVKGRPLDARQGLPSASAMLAQRLRAVGVGQPKTAPSALHEATSNSTYIT